jgi:hypothetical protein
MKISPETKVNIIKLIFIILTFLVISFFAFSCCSTTQENGKTLYYEINIYNETSTQPIETYQAEKYQNGDNNLIFWCNGMIHRTNRKFLLIEKYK